MPPTRSAWGDNSYNNNNEDIEINSDHMSNSNSNNNRRGNPPPPGKNGSGVVGSVGGKPGGGQVVKEESGNGMQGSTNGNGNGNGQAGDDTASRSKRSCLACRKLKTRCDESEEPPCKRCRQGGHECIFVESKRGKRPVRKPTDPSLADKFRNVEKTLSMVIQSMNSGAPPDVEALSQLQASLQEGLAADKSSREGTGGGGANSSGGEDDGPSVRPTKRRRESAASASAASASVGATSGTTKGESPMSTTSNTSYANSNLSPNLLSGQLGTPRHQHSASLSMGRTPTVLSGSPFSPNSAHSNSLSSPKPPGSSLSLLADASLAAEIDGRTQLTGLDPTFNLSSVTDALVNNGSGGGAGKGLANGMGLDGEEMERTPGILMKGIVDAETAVELFRIFFDYAYIHLPLLDPSQNSATSVCRRSPFLFTVICAVASRFHSDPSLHTKCYDEAHACFVDCVSNGERSIESVQACMILTVWTNAPKQAEDRPQRAWLYFGMAVRMGLELGLFRPPAFVDAHLVKNSTKANPWANLKDVSEEEQRDALNRERTWLMVFVIDRNMSAVMGRPYQIHEAKPLLIPLHPMSLPFDLGVIAHQELQSVIGQVMDTFRDRIYGLSSACDEMPSPVVMKLFNSRMDEWRQRWCPVAGEPIANNLLFYFYSSKLFLNTFPLHTMLRVGDAVDDPSCVSSTINSAKAILDLGHAYATLGVLRHCPDVNFLLLLYAAVFLIKVKASNTRFAQLVDETELEKLLKQSMDDCSKAVCSTRHAAATCLIMLRALVKSWKAMRTPSNGTTSADGNQQPLGGGLGMMDFSLMGQAPQTHQHQPHQQHQLQQPQAYPQAVPHNPGDIFANLPSASSLGLHGTLAGAPTSPAPYAYLSSPFASTSGRPGGSGTNTPGGFGNFPSGNLDGFANDFLNDTNFFQSVLVSKGMDGFFSWGDGMDTVGGMDAPLVNGFPAGFGDDFVASNGNVE